MKCNRFEIDPLPYAYDGLMPYIDGETLRVHHDILYQRYVDKLNAALSQCPEYYCYSLEELILGCAYLPRSIAETVFRQAGGAFNHGFYFDRMNPKHREPSGELTEAMEPSGGLTEAMEACFGGFEGFKKQWKAAAMTVFGSGWTWLCADERGLEIVNTADQITPLTLGKHPLLCIDLWEHAYFLQYQAARDTYIDAWFHVVDWRKVGESYEKLWCFGG